MPSRLREPVTTLSHKMRKAVGPSDGRAPRLRSLLEGALGAPFTDGNNIDILKNGEEIFPAMLDAIRNARSTIELLTFVYWSGRVAGEFARALSERSRAGVEVFLLLDGFGAAKIDDSLVESMRDAGVYVQWFRPLTKVQPWKDNHRTHRKLLVCDGDVAFTGGVGIAQEWDGDARNPSQWRDTHFRVRGPAVRHLQAAFLDNWMESGRPLLELKRHVNSPRPAGNSAVQVVRSTASIGWNDTATLIKVMFAYAKRRIWVTTGFFVVDESTQDLLISAAQKGVDVRIMYPGKHHDSRVSKVAGERKVQPLLNAGVKVYRYQKTMLHAKVILIDETIAAVGSTNLNQRSLLKDDEVSIVIDDREISNHLSRHFREDLEFCRESRKGRWSHRGVLQRVKELVAAPVQRHV